MQMVARQERITQQSLGGTSQEDFTWLGLYDDFDIAKERNLKRTHLASQAYKVKTINAILYCVRKGKNRENLLGFNFDFMTVAECCRTDPVNDAYR
jgi:hypothetical protein